MAINLVVGLVITSYAVNNLGLEVYGAWSILMLFMLLGVIGDQSIASPIVYLAAKYHSSNELQKLSSLYVNGFALVTVICFAFTLIFAFYGKFISMFLFNNLDYLLYVKYIGAMISIFLYGSLSSAILNGCGRNDLAFINRSVSRVVQLAVVILLLESEFGILSLFLGLAAHHAVLLIMSFYQSLGLVSIHRGRLKKVIIMKILHIGGPSLAGRLIGMLSDPLIKVHLSRSVGLESVGSFDVAQKANASVSALPVSALSNIPAQIMKLNHGNKIPSEAVRIFRKKAWIYMGLFGIPAFFVVQFFLPLLLSIWLGAYEEELILTIRMLLVAYLLHSFSMVDLNVMLGFGKTKLQLYSNIVTVIVIMFFLLASFWLDIGGYFYIVIGYCFAIIAGSFCNIIYTINFLYNNPDL